MEQKKAKAYRQGILVFVGLVILTLIEYVVGTNGGFLPAMVLLAIVKAGLVIWYYMHLRSVFRPDERGHK